MEKDELYESYNSNISSLPLSSQNTCGILYSIVLTVVNNSSPSKSPEQDLSFDNAVVPVTQFIKSKYFNDEFYAEGVEISTEGPTAILQALIHNSNQSINRLPDDVITSEYENEFILNLRNIEEYKKDENHIASTPTVEGLAEFERNSIIRSQMFKLLLESQTDFQHPYTQPFPMKPLLSVTERGMKESELMHFSSLSPVDFYRSHQMLEFNNILVNGNFSKVLPNFTNQIRTSDGEDGSVLKRRYFKSISPLTFCQTLTKERLREPIVIKNYYALTDELLYGLHWPPPERRTKVSVWEPPATVLKILYPPANETHEDEGVEHEHKKKSNSRPSSRSHSRTSKQDVPENITQNHNIMNNKSHKINNVTLTPAGKAIVMIKEFESAHDPLPWLSIHMNDSIIGLRVYQLVDSSIPDVLVINHSEHGDVGVGHTSHSRLQSRSNSRRPSKDPVQTNNVVHVPKMKKMSCFFCQTEDNIRIVASPGPSPAISVKPDKLGTVLLSFTYPEGMIVTMCSNGVYSVKSPIPTSHVHMKKNYDPLINEITRYVGANGTILRLLTDEYDCNPFSQDILEIDGTRTLINRDFTENNPTTTALPSDQIEGIIESNFSHSNDVDPNDVNNTNNISSANNHTNNNTPNLNNSKQQINLKNYKKINSFYKELLSNAPENWNYIRFKPNGQILFFTCTLGTTPEPEGIECTSSIMNNHYNYTIDAETNHEIIKLSDGRIIINYTNNRKEVYFNEGTIISMNETRNFVFINNLNGIPSIEIDLEVDNVSRNHSKGIEVPINKSGERVRSRIAMPDGSAGMIKYDTKVTATTNGSIKIVRRDKTVIIVKDDGNVAYIPRTAWNEQSSVEFRSECSDIDLKIKSLQGNKTHNNNVHHNDDPLKSSINSSTSTLPTNNKNKSETKQSNKNNKATKVMNTSTPLLTKSEKIGKTHNKNVLFSSTDDLGVTEKQSSIIDPTSSSQTITEKDIFLSTKAEETKFSFNFIKATCSILDYEYNRFEIDLINNPLAPKVLLSGEVEGLKPPAVSDSPMEPRLFIVNRAGEATEVLSIKQVSSLESLLVRNPEDVSKYSYNIHSNPSILGNIKQHHYLIRRRLLGKYNDSFAFHEVFGDRLWHGNYITNNLPSGALAALRSNPLFNYLRSELKVPNKSPPVYYESHVLIEQMPLSKEGYQQLVYDLEKCEQFRSDRLKSIDRYAVEDKRSPTEIDDVEKMIIRLKHAFKAAKKAIQKNKEKNAVDEAAPSVILEGTAEEEEEEEDKAVFDDDEDEPSAEELELREAYNDFAIEINSNSIGFHSEVGLFLPMVDLREALIRVLNCNVAQEVLKKALISCGIYDNTFDNLNLNEFRAVYRSVQNIMNIGNDNDRIDVDHEEFHDDLFSIHDVIDPNSPSFGPSPLNISPTHAASSKVSPHGHSQFGGSFSTFLQDMKSSPTANVVSKKNLTALPLDLQKVRSLNLSESNSSADTLDNNQIDNIIDAAGTGVKIAKQIQRLNKTTSK
eukprot:gene10744-14429_t